MSDLVLAGNSEFISANKSGRVGQMTNRTESLLWPSGAKINVTFTLLFVLVSRDGVSIGTTNDAIVTTSRLPRINLLVYHNHRGEVLPVKTKSGWQKRRDEILRGFQEIAGPLPGRAKGCALDVRVEERTDCGTYERQLVTYQSEPGAQVPAYLLIPKAALNSRKKFPAILCLHPTDMQYGQIGRAHV